MLHEAGQFRNQLVQPFIFSEKICEKVLFTTNSGHLQALKVCDLKVNYHAIMTTMAPVVIGTDYIDRHKSN
jgi:peptidase E